MGCVMNDALIDILVCPICCGKLHLNKSSELVCYKDNIAYPIVNNVPCLIVEKGRIFANGEKND